MIVYRSLSLSIDIKMLPL